MDAGTADEPSSESSSAAIPAATPEHDTSSASAPLVPNFQPNEITIPRLRPSMQKPYNNSIASSSQPASSPPKPNRRSPSKSPRKSIDGRPVIRSTKISVRVKPRSVATTIAASTHSATGPSVPPLQPSSSPRKTPSSSLRKVSSTSPRKPSSSRQVQPTEHDIAQAANLGALRGSGMLKARYSVKYRGPRVPRAAAASSTPASPAPASPVTMMPASGGEWIDSGETTAAPKDAAESAPAVSPNPTPPQEDPVCGPQPTPSAQTSSEDEAEKLAEAWRGIQHKERQLKMREDALKAGQKLLRQDREAFEKEKRHFHDEQQQRRTREDENRKRRTQKRSRSRSRSKPRGKVIPDDSWRRGDHKSKQQQQQQQQNERHTSWSSINTGGTSTPSPYPSDAESTTTASTFPKPRRPPATRDDDDDDDEELTWTSSPTAFRAAYARYTTAWASLPPHSPLIPYPSPTHAAAQLRQTSHLPLSAQHGWSADAVVKYNAVHFFLAAHGVPVAPDVGAARPKVGLKGVGDGDGDESLKQLVREVRRELRRWHEDGLKWRGGGEGGRANEALVGDETARAVFRAFTELRDGLLAEVRWRRENGVAAAKARAKAKAKAKATTSGGGSSGATGEDQDQGYGGTGMDWTVLSEAIL